MRRGRRPGEFGPKARQRIAWRWIGSEPVPILAAAVAHRGRRGPMLCCLLAPLDCCANGLLVAVCPQSLAWRSLFGVEPQPLPLRR